MGHFPGNPVNQYTERVEFTDLFIVKGDQKAEKVPYFSEKN